MDLDLLTALLLDPCLTVTEAEREAAAYPAAWADRWNGAPGGPPDTPEAWPTPATEF